MPMDSVRLVSIIWPKQLEQALLLSAKMEFQELGLELRPLVMLENMLEIIIMAEIMLETMLTLEITDMAVPSHMAMKAVHIDM